LHVEEPQKHPLDKYGDLPQKKSLKKTGQILPKSWRFHNLFPQKMAISLGKFSKKFP
jgi:hypothetical protein